VKYLVTKKWVVEVSDEDVKRFSAAAGRELDPRQIAITKAIGLLIEFVHTAIEDPTDPTQIAFDVEPWKGTN
jgi:hypothetical protein